MCLITLAVHTHPDYPLIIAANRDEFFARETQSMRLWHDVPIIAGRDLEAGGTWMGVSSTGRIAMVTNYREASRVSQAYRSRGELTTDFLTTNEKPATYLSALQQHQQEYQGFNLIVGDAKDLLKNKPALRYCSNRLDDAATTRGTAATNNELDYGVFSLSNALLDTPWPKTTRSTRAMEQVVSEIGSTLLTTEQIKQALFEQMRDNELADRANIPNTGVDPTLEYHLSSRFVDASRHDYRYGTRVSTCILLNKRGEFEIQEITYDSQGKVQETQQHQLAL